MNKIIPLSLVAIVSLYATEVYLAPIGVESTVITEVAEKAETSADVAVAISSRVPSIDMSRRSGIANDILIRGQKRDNISIEVDGTKINGACPNRMDPPTSHILANQIETIEVTEGPYDVATFGVMSGGVKIKTKKPTKNFKGEVNVGMGSFGYQKLGATVSGGNDLIRVSITASTEKSDQYKDGNGDTFAEQIINSPTAPATARYQTQYQDMQAYTKKSIMAKAFITVTDNQELRLSVTANRSDDILYANSTMDALYDDSNIYSIEYNINTLTDVYSNMNLQYYYSDVDHPMATTYRDASLGTNPVIKNWLTTEMQGLKFKNTFDIQGHKILVGIDGSKRTWDGHYESDNLPLATGRKSIDNAVTKNTAIFSKLSKSVGEVDFTFGARYDYTKITNDGGFQNNNYSGINANLTTTLNLDKESKVFFAFGQAKRVPDARELYFRGSQNNVVGTQDLKQTTNREIDVGYEIATDAYSAKVKSFYSRLSDYIYIQKGVSVRAFQNIDAIVYGMEVSGEYYVSDDITVEASASYKVGKKDNALAGQTDTDLADIAPLRANITTTYEYANHSSVSAEIQASDTWDTIDSDNGEQKLDAWAILNLKAKHSFNKSFELTVGVNNVFNTTYAVSNTYTDLTLLTTSTTTDVMLFNNPGRYVYTNVKYTF
ncbi:TonB-dependent receptor [Sulfurimonas sp. SAG-AH-194-I05]|nr:TonB-dependent receptor [Sulfurimonas sp. SAG-AH-194-I05]MDF1874279.1 TonB-dependent receptor [Sulfurimonas sp. SAG-AH-194-I05]